MYSGRDYTRGVRTPGDFPRWCRWRRSVDESEVSSIKFPSRQRPLPPRVVRSGTSGVGGSRFRPGTDRQGTPLQDCPVQVATFGRRTGRHSTRSPCFTQRGRRIHKRSGLRVKDDVPSIPEGDPLLRRRRSRVRTDLPLQ